MFIWMRHCSRQWLYPKEFRIGRADPPPPMSVGLETSLGDLCVLFETLSQKASSELPPRDRPQVLSKFVCDVSTEIWRLGNRVRQLANETQSEEIRKIARGLDRAEGVLHDTGVEVHDYTGKPYRAGMAIKVIGYVPREGVPEGVEIIVEMLKPSIYLGGTLIGWGEAIVAYPATPEGPPKQRDSAPELAIMNDISQGTAEAGKEDSEQGISEASPNTKSDSAKKEEQK